jgi:DNA-directed RNA polymerase III subunit RPC2
LLDINIGTPQLVEGYLVEKETTPMECRLRNLTYAAPIFADISYTRGSEFVKTREVIGRMPIMLRSNRCVLTGKSPPELAQKGECPIDPGMMLHLSLSPSPTSSLCPSYLSQ